MRMHNFALLSWHTKFLQAAVLYNAVVFAVFYTIYTLIDFSKHFTSDTPVTGRGKLYFAVMAHSAGGSNDIVPKTDVARVITAAHVALAWMQLLLVFLPS